MTESDLVRAWARAFTLTVAVELAVAVPLLERYLPSLPRRITLVVFAQLASHPLFWFVLPSMHLGRTAFLVSGEVWAWLIEALLYVVAAPPLPPRRGVTIAFVANGASFVAWLLLRTVATPR